ncbi:MAG TPA: hypothetical protein VGQ23_07400, partial [Burkholderiaceae bacterium]|nr:hypothetical protein [Burkholderiaceae bacterium]
IVLLLHLKRPMHRFVAAMGERDVAAVMQFALITLVILPVLPNRGYGPHDVLNPFKVWLMVVLIVAVSLAGYVAYKLVGTRAAPARAPGRPRRMPRAWQRRSSPSPRRYLFRALPSSSLSWPLRRR